MKKVLFLFSILIFCSCTINSDIHENKKNRNSSEEIKEFKYKKHSYIMFYKEFETEIVHDPECEYCLSKFD